MVLRRSGLGTDRGRLTGHARRQAGSNHRVVVGKCHHRRISVPRVPPIRPGYSAAFLGRRCPPLVSQVRPRRLLLLASEIVCGRPRFGFVGKRARSSGAEAARADSAPVQLSDGGPGNVAQHAISDGLSQPLLVSVTPLRRSDESLVLSRCQRGDASRRCPHPSWRSNARQILCHAYSRPAAECR